jgi:hypothetical protein
MVGLAALAALAAAAVTAGVAHRILLSLIDIDGCYIEIDR